MAKIYIRPVRLNKWFPPHDPLATIVARLCILREDFALEMRGMMAEHIIPLDEHSAQWRRLYFFRNIVRTLSEIRSAIETLRRNSHFKRMLSEESEPKQVQFGELLEKLNRDHPVLKEVRNSVGGHVLEVSVQKGLNGIAADFDSQGFIEIGGSLGKSHYKFAYQLVVATLLGETPDAERTKKLEDVFRTIGGLITVFEIVEKIVVMYATDRELI